MKEESGNISKLLPVEEMCNSVGGQRESLRVAGRGDTEQCHDETEILRWLKTKKMNKKKKNKVHHQRSYETKCT